MPTYKTMSCVSVVILALVAAPLISTQCLDDVTDCAELGCDANEWDAFCRAVNLTCIPSCISRTTVYATFINNLIRSLTADSFRHMPFVNTLDLSNNPLESIASDTFRYILDLTAVNIDNNNLLVLPADLFTFMPNTYFISLNNLVTRTSIDANIFSNILGLQFLYIGGSDLTGISESTFSQLRDLEYLYIPRNGLAQLPENIFRSNTKLRVLDIGGNNLSELPSNIFSSLNNLLELSINDNQITDFQNDLFNNTVNVTSLDLSDNRLTGLNRLTFQPMRELKTLMLYGNQLSQIQYNETFMFNERLWIFNIRNNSLTSLNPLVFSGNRDMFVYLEGNPWNCDCTTVALMNAFREQGIQIFEDPGCLTPPELSGTPWLNLTLACGK